MVICQTTALLDRVAVVAGALGILTALHAGRRQGLRAKASTVARVLERSFTRRVVAAQEVWARLPRLRPMGVRVWQVLSLVSPTTSVAVAVVLDTLHSAAMAVSVAVAAALLARPRAVGVR